jgi:hypothetical protein
LATNVIDTDHVFNNYENSLIRFMSRLEDPIFYIESHVAIWTDVPSFFEEEYNIICSHEGGGRFKIYSNPYSDSVVNSVQKKKEDILFDINEIVG